ncbi:hypothetical protein UFOVP326_75 [uncultured Caudovirales phage]|uniref:Uncharacterized protein n=1 Tax=uncultured Caudovirales phage TaxID=2100421 RepID=A0A6J5LT81_9CAUD|nr:hypothetical protein UFOVP326_75 [uncultured Caudovirales phage]
MKTEQANSEGAGALPFYGIGLEGVAGVAAPDATLLQTLLASERRKVATLERELEAARAAHGETMKTAAWDRARVATLANAVLAAEVQFDAYAAAHREKGMEEGEAKAATNAYMAEKMRAAREITCT